MTAEAETNYDGWAIVVSPRRPEYSIAGRWLIWLALPWAVAIIVAATWVAQIFGASIPDIPMWIRAVVTAVAMAPIAIAFLASGLGPVPGLGWMFRLPVPKIRLNSDGLTLLAGGPEDSTWSVRWEDVVELQRIGMPGHIDVVTRGGSVSLPASLSLGRIDGTGKVVSVWGLIEAWPPFQQSGR